MPIPPALGVCCKEVSLERQGPGAAAPSQLPTQSPSLDHLVNLSLQTNLGDKELSVTFVLLAPP